MMIPSITLFLLVSSIQTSYSLKVKVRESSVAKYDFIREMRKAGFMSRSKNDDNDPFPKRRKMNWTKLTDNSIHIPPTSSSDSSSLRSSNYNPQSDSKRISSSSSSSSSSSTPNKRSTETDRELSWYSFWSNKDEEVVEDFQDEVEGNGNTWWNWNWNWTNWTNNQDNQANEDEDANDMWNYQVNRTYIMEGLSDFSFKFAGCASLTSYSDESDLPIVQTNLVSYRLCPSETCRDNSWSGCRQTYGEYMMSLETFLEAQQDYVDDEFSAYCSYCYNCMFYDKWFSGYNQNTSQYDEDVHGCDYWEQCSTYEYVCDPDKAEEEQQQQQDQNDQDEQQQVDEYYTMTYYNYEDFLTCEEIEIDLSYYGVDVEVDDRVEVDDMYGNNNEANYNLNKAYIGPHCNNGELGIGLFLDEDCTHFVGDKFDIYNVTSFEEEIDVVQDLFIPSGCHSCAGENLYDKWFYVPEDEKEEEEYEQYKEQQENDENMDEYISQLCYNMYTQSGKCHSHFDENGMVLELSDDEILTEETTCDFIEDVVKGHYSEDGFVYSHQGNVFNPISSFFELFSDDMEKDVTGAQIAALVLGALSCSLMAGFAYILKMQVDSPGYSPTSEGLLANVIGTSA